MKMQGVLSLKTNKKSGLWTQGKDGTGNLLETWMPPRLPLYQWSSGSPSSFSLCRLLILLLGWQDGKYGDQHFQSLSVIVQSLGKRVN